MKHQNFTRHGKEERTNVTTKTEKQSLEFATVKAGDRVWLRSDHGRTPRGGGMKKVIATTAAFIYLEGSKEFNTYKRDGCQYGKHLNGKITGVATPQECAAWDAERAQEAEVRSQRETAKQAAEAKRTGLQSLFGESVASISVAHWGTTDERKDKFDVTFHGLTEAQVRELAAKVAV